jgi:GNAT superfamily N-acetyltransferase
MKSSSGTGRGHDEVSTALGNFPGRGPAAERLSCFKPLLMQDGNVSELIIVEESIGNLDKHASIPTAFVVERVLEVSVLNEGLGGIVLQETVLDTPWVKDYDAIDGEGPTQWPKRFDISNWALLVAYREEERVGGAVIAYKTVGVHMLEGAVDKAALWDLRVQPLERSRGVGSALFTATEDWCRHRGCRELKIETQNINVPACRFYAHMSCTLGAINRHAYSELEGETQLLWYKKLL